MSERDTIKKVSFENTEIAFGHKTDKELGFSIFIFKMMQSPMMVKLGTSLANLALSINLPVVGLIKNTVFKQFCGGESINDCDSSIVKLGKANIGAILDYSVEGAEEEAVFDATKDEIIKVIEKAKNTPSIPVSCMKITGVGKFGLLEKVSANQELKQNEKLEYAKLIKRVEEICRKAYDCDVPIYIDAEESWIQIAIDRLTESMMRKYNKKKAIVFTTLQMYRWDKIEHLNKLVGEARQEGFIPGIKFVRGAYMEKENERAASMGYKSPIQPDKPSTDRDYNKALEIAMENIDILEICCGTHNEESSLLLTELMAKKGLENSHPHIYFSQLYGMSDHISYNLSNAGYNVSKYLPYGPVKATIPYLSRRAEENSAIAGQMGKELTLLLREKKRRQ